MNPSSPALGALPAEYPAFGAAGSVHLRCSPVSALGPVDSHPGSHAALARPEESLGAVDRVSAVDGAHPSPPRGAFLRIWSTSAPVSAECGGVSRGTETTRAFLLRIQWSHPAFRRIYAVSTALRVRLQAGALDPLCMFRDGGLGDIIATFPAVSRLRHIHRRPVWYFCNPAFSELPPLSGLADRTIPIRCNDAVAGLLRGRMRTFEFRYPDEAGIPAAGAPEPLFAQMGRSVGVDGLSPPRIPPPAPSPHATALLARLPPRFVCVHTGPTAPVRQWPEIHWNECIQKLGSDWAVVQIGSNAHFQHRGVSAGALPGAIDARGLASLSDVLAVLGRATMFVGVDSGLLHAARALGVPTVGLFGAVDPRHRHDNRADSILLTARAVGCLGCHHRAPRLHWDKGCPHGIACMRALSPEQVLDAVRSLVPR